MLNSDQLKYGDLKVIVPEYEFTRMVSGLNSPNHPDKVTYFNQLESRLSQLLGGSFTCETIDNSTYYICECVPGKKYALLLLQKTCGIYMRHTVCVKPSFEECQRTAVRLFSKC